MNRINILATLFFFVLLMTISSFSNAAETLRPNSISDLQRTSVKVMNLKESSGGTGAILKSFKTGSHILTNKHVCRLIEQGGVVAQGDKRYLITHYKKFPHHDLCLVRVKNDLGINLVISDKVSKQSSTAYVSGHPSLLPHIASKGHLSAHEDIQLVVGLKKCNEENFKKNAAYCIFFGGIPVVQTFESVVVSNLIMPGSSGSSIFNKNGEIVGVIYAGNGRGLSYGYAVPHIHLLYFIQNSRRFKWVKVGTEVSDKGLIDRIFNFDKCQQGIRAKSIRDFCRSVENNMIWRK